MRHEIRLLALAAMMVASTSANAFSDAAGRYWPSLQVTWNVPLADFLAVCSPVTGLCSGSVTSDLSWPPGTPVDLSGYVWASFEETIAYTAHVTSIDSAVLAAGWELECDNSGDGCPPVFAVWWDFMEYHKTRSGHSSYSFNGIYRDAMHASEGDAAAFRGYLMGEGTASFGDTGGIDLSVPPDCGLNDDDCWGAFGYFLYTPAVVPEPTVLALLSFGLAGLGIARRRRV